MAYEVSKEAEIKHSNGLTNKGETSHAYTPHEQAQASFTNSLNSFFLDQYILPPQPHTKQLTFTQAWLKARDNKKRRVATGRKWNKETKQWEKAPKTPFKKNWTTREEKESSKQLTKKYGEYGERLGHKYKDYWDYEIDLDFYKEGRPNEVSEHFKNSFIKITKLLKLKWWETSNGNARLNLLSKEELTRSILYITITDKWGNKHAVGEVLGKKRQVRATHKKERGEGKWKLKVDKLEQAFKIFRLFFFDFSDTKAVKAKVKEKDAQIIPRSIKVYKPLKPSENIRRNISEANNIIKTIKTNKEKTQILKNIRIGPRKQLRRAKSEKPLYKQLYNGKKYFLIDTKYSGGFSENTILDDLPMGSIRSVVLAQGDKHQFYKQLWHNTT